MRYLLAAVLIIAASPAAADDLAARFATRPTAFSVALSPDGDKVAFVGAYKTGGYAVTIADLKTGESKAILAGSSGDVTPRSCRFKSETRLICTLVGLFKVVDYTKTSDFERIMAIDADGSNRKLLGEKRGGERFGASVIDYLPDDPNHVLMEAVQGYVETTNTLVKPAAEGLGAALVDIRTGARTFVEKPTPSTAMLMSDHHGNVRLKAAGSVDPDGVIRASMNYTVRAKGSRDWQKMTQVNRTDERAVEFAGFDESGDHLYELAPLEGRTALYSVAADGSGARTLVYANPKVDVDGVARIGKYRRPIGAAFTEEREAISYFDPALSKLAAALGRALPGHPGVEIRDESWDGTKYLIYADAPNVPGHYYLYDTKAKSLGPLLAAYPGLDGVALGEVRAVSYPARDGTAIPAFLTLPPGHTDARGLPALLLPHGGPSARDAAGFDWLTQFFAAEGFAVLQPNYRGSSGYGETFFNNNAFKGWALAMSDINDGARWLVMQGAPKDKVAIFGWSYGGYAALQANVVEQGLYRAAVAVAPVTDLDLLRSEYLRFTNTKLVGAQVSSDTMRAGSPAKNAAKIAVPVLLFSGDHDLNVDIEHSRVMVSALKAAGKQVDFVQFNGLDHQLDDSDARKEMLAKSAAFLKAAVN